MGEIEGRAKEEIEECKEDVEYTEWKSENDRYCKINSKIVDDGLYLTKCRKRENFKTKYCEHLKNGEDA